MHSPDPPSPASQGQLDPNPRRVRLWLSLAALVALAIHARGLWGEPVYLDDNTAPWAETPGMTAGGTVAWTLSVLADPTQRELPAPWEPLPALLLALTPAFGEFSIRAMHALSLLAHAGAVFALGRLALTLGASRATAIGAALLFGAHPVTVQSTAWISAFSAVLAGLFGLLALDSFARGWKAGRVEFSAGAFLLLGLLSSPLALAVLPIALVLLYSARGTTADAPPPARSHFAPLVASCLFAWLLRAAVFGSGTAGYSDELSSLGWRGTETLIAGLETFGGALRILAWPDEANPFRTPSVGLGLFDAALAPAWGFAAGALVLLGLAAWARARRLAALIGALLASLLPLAIASHTMSVFPLSDHHLYLPAAAFALVIAHVLVRRPGLPAPIGMALMAVVVGGYAWLCQPRIATWSDDIALLKDAAQRNPQSPYAHWVYAHELLFEYQQHGELDSLTKAHATVVIAQDLLDSSKEPGARILATPEDFLQTNLGLGWCLLALAEVDGYYDFETPHTIFGLISESHPRSVQALLGSGLASIGLGDDAAAEEAFRAALKVAPGSPDAYHDLGRLMIARQNWKEAQRCFEKALLRRPNQREDRVWLARSLFQQGWLDRARRSAVEAHELDPFHPEAMVLLGVIALAQEHPGDAQRWIDRALLADPNDGFARLQRGRVFEARGDIQNAMFEYKRATVAMPNSFEAYYNLGNSLLMLGESKVAAEQFLHAYELHPPDQSRSALRTALRAAFPALAGAHFGFAGIDHAREDTPGCAEWIASALAIDPGHAGALHLLGITQRQAGAMDAAQESFRAALARLPNSFQVRHDLGYLLLAMDQEDEALTHLRRALELVPPTPDAPEIASAIRTKLATTIAELDGNE